MIAPLGPAIAAELEDPPNSAAAVVPSDTLSIPDTLALYIGVSGDVTVTMARLDAAGSGGKVTFKAVPVGLLAIRVRPAFHGHRGAANPILGGRAADDGGGGIAGVSR